MSRLRAFALAAACAAPALAAPPTPLDGFLAAVEKTTLPNGVTLLVRAQPGTGVVAIDTWVKAGYFHEPDEVAGMAHLFEHMFFKGSAKFPGAERIAQELAAVGGDSNAGTIYDSTNYYFVVPAEGFARAAEIMADAIAHPTFDPAELAKEAEVVIEESNRKLDNPVPLSLERMLAVSFTEHRIKRWRIGSNEVLRNIRRDDLLAFFATLYRPENLIVAVAGDVTHAEARRIAEASFGALPRGELVKRRGPSEPPQTAFRYGRSSGDLQQGYSVLGWHTVGVGGDDELALDLAAAILGDGRSSRLFRHAVGPEAAATANAAHWQFEDVGVFMMQASFDEGRRAEVDRRLLAEIERLKAHGPTEAELRVAKNVARSQTVLGLEDALGQAQALAYAEANYGYRALGDRIVAREAVTAAQVRDAARRYLTVDRLTLYHYAPNGAPGIDAGTALAAVRAATATAPAAETATPIPAAAAALRAAAAAGPAVEVALPNGVPLVVRERPGAPAVSLGVYFRGGQGDESSADAGVTRLMAASLRRGTTSRSGEEIDRAFELLGTQLRTDVAADYFGFALSVEASNLRPAVELLADVVLRPTFPADGVERERALQLAAIKRSFDSAVQRPFALADGQLYPAHAYGQRANGAAASVARLDREALAAWWRRQIAAEDAVLFVVGDVDAGDARALVGDAFAALPARGAPRTAAPPPLPMAARSELVEFRDRRQSAIVLGFPAVPAGHADAPALTLLQKATSGLAGTFFAELRGRRSLAYTVFTAPDLRRDGGAFYAYLASEAKKEDEAKAALLAEVRRLAADGLTAADLERAKSSYAGETRIELQTNGAILADYAQSRFLGLGLDGTEKRLAAASRLSLDEVRAAARRHLAGDLFTTAVLRGKS
ncbi:MAG: insulinase family protein [Thermoanaerobaculia bacterium]|nr:insulinase family protein [Thermoanaerobaculia bacterium]